MNRRRFLSLALSAPAIALAGCKNGHVNLFGYTTEPPFDPCIRSIYIPVFKLDAFVTTPHRNFDVEITEAIVRELTARKCPMRVVSDPTKADTELVGTIIQVQKIVVNRNPQNLAREAEIAVTVDIIWRDLRTGDLITNPPPRMADKPMPTPSVGGFDPSLQPPLPPPPNDQPIPVRIVEVGRVMVELGESSATAQKSISEKLARKIVNMMERNWNTPRELK